jgi:hypothetical protein
MATIKSFTDLEQSKRLAEILSIESADHYYSWHDKQYYVVNKDCPYPYSLKERIPCWSLAALLSVLPDKIHLDNETYHLNFNKDEVKYLGSITWDGQKCISSKADTIVDACYEMIEKLHERNLL